MARTSTKTLSTFGTNVSRLLKTKGIGRKALAEHVGVHPSTLWRWMTTDKAPASDTLAEISTYLGVSMAKLISAKKKGGTGKKKKTAASA